MAESNIYRHVIRLNLDNPLHMELHHHLMNLDPDAFKSKNEYLIQMMLTIAKGYKAEEGVKDKEEEIHYLTEHIEEIKRDITQTVMNEVLKTLLNMVVSRPNMIYPSSTVEKTPYEDDVDDALKSAAYGYFDD